MLKPLQKLVFPGTSMHDPLPSELMAYICGVPCLSIYPSGLSHTDSVVVYLHGNSEDLQSSWRRAVITANATRSRVVVPEYRGYGIRSGPPDPEGTVVDVNRVLRALHNPHVIGYSIGTAVAAQSVAGVQGVASVSLVAPFYSLERAATRVVPVWLAKLSLAFNSIFDTRCWIQKVRAPVFILHGTEDDLIPWQDGRDLHKEVKGSIFALQSGSDHANLNFSPVYEWIRSHTA